MGNLVSLQEDQRQAGARLAEELHLLAKIDSSVVKSGLTERVIHSLQLQFYQLQLIMHFIQLLKKESLMQNIFLVFHLL